MSMLKSVVSRFRGLPGAVAVAAGMCVAAQSASAGTWTKVVNNPPGSVGLMLLLSDGTVMCSNPGTSNAWYKLTPNAAGSYVNGTWTTLAPMLDTRLYIQTQVLKDGRVYCSGGEYGTGGPKASVYDPTTNVWTALTIPASLWNPATDNFYDCNSEILPDGSVLLMPVFPHTSGRAIKWNPATNVWSSGGQLFRGTYQDEATWVKLPDNTILTLDPFGSNSYGNSPSERYNPVTNTWINDGISPVNLYDAFGFEMGGGVYLPNGKAIFLGATGNTAIYTPTGTTSPGSWVAGPVIPSSKGTPDAPLAPMIDGKVLCAVSPLPTSANHFPTPTTFYEYDYVTNSFASITGPTGASDNISCYQANMLCLPNGQILYSHMSNTVYAYTPTGSQIAAGKPAVTSITANGDGSFHLTGTLLNGISEGASYGDDWQMNTNYPVIRINHSNGNKYYARTYNWSSTSIATGATPTTTEYKLPAGMPAGSYTLVVTANGFASDAVGAPAISPNPSNQAVRAVYQSASFTVGATGVGPITYQWRRNGVNLTNGGAISGATSTTLTFNPAHIADNGTTIDCVVSNAIGSATSTGATYTVYCPSDFNQDGFVSGDDFDTFVDAFYFGDPSADFNSDTFVSGEDFDAFMDAFIAGC